MAGELRVESDRRYPDVAGSCDKTCFHRCGYDAGANSSPRRRAVRGLYGTFAICGLIALWHDLQTELAKDEVEIARCRKDVNCGAAAAQRLISIIDEARQYSGRKMIGHLNRGINGAIQSTRMIVPWLPPLAALSQPGDCKSYAIVKYLALGELGIAASDRRLVILRGVSRPRERHLVVLVRDDDRWIILDNQTLTLVDSVAARQYEPLTEFDANGVRDF
jgi:predicted transglutaminase-like cysteine proteinase